MNMYRAVVKFVSKEPYDAGFGPSINTKLKFDDQDAPGTKDGERTVYASVDSPEADVIRSLSPGDVVMAQALPRGKKTVYIIHKETSPQPQATMASRQPTQVEQAKRPVLWSPMSAESKVVWGAIAEEEVGKMQVCFALVNEWLGDLPVGEKLDMAVTVFINAQKRFRPDMIHESDYVDTDAALLAMINPNDQVNTLMDSITVLVPFYENRDSLVETFRSLGLSGRDVSGEDSWLRMLHIAQDYANMVESGASVSVAHSAVADKYELPSF